MSRRYADRSYLVALDRLTEPQSLDLYAELLLKIDTYHVSDPNWSQLVQRGMTHLQVASMEPVLAQRHPRPVTGDLMREFLEQARASVDVQRIENRQQAVDAVGQIARLAARHMAVPSQTTILEFACAAAISLDHYSAFLTEDQLDEVFSQIEGNFVGLGVELRGDGQSLLIVHVIPGGPAAEAGIVPHDRIVEVDGQPTALMTTDAAADMLRGPDLSFVEILVESPDGARRACTFNAAAWKCPACRRPRSSTRTTGWPTSNSPASKRRPAGTWTRRSGPSTDKECGP